MGSEGDVEKLHAAAFEEMALAALVIDLTGSVADANAAWRALAGDVRRAPHRDAFGRIVGDAAAGELATIVDGLLLGAREAHRAELRGRDAASERWFDVRLSRVAGKGVVATLEDVTARRTVRDAARDADGLRESEATLRAILDAIPDLVFRMRRDGSLVEHGDAVARSTRGPRGLNATIAEQSAMDAQRALATRTPKAGLCRVTERGQSRDYETRLVPYGDDEALVIARDISDYTRTEEELQLFLGISLTTSEVPDLGTALTVVLRQICESTGWVAGAAWTPTDAGLQCDAVWLARESPELAAFRAACQAHSLQRNEALVGAVLGRARAAWVGNLDATRDGGARARAAGFRTGFAVPVLAGAEVVAVLEFYAFEPRDEDQRLLTMVSAVAEQLGALVKRKRAEELVESARAELQRALETAARQWRITFDAIESPIFLLDRDGRVVRVNRAAKTIAGVDYKEQIGRALEEIGDGEPWRGGAAVARAALERRAAASAQAHDEVRKQTWDFAATLIDDDDGEKIILVMRDITRLVELQESLRRSETMSAMGSLVAGVAHEVRNPLHAITVTLDAFEARFRVPVHSGHIGVLRGEVARMSTLMRDLLEYGKPPTARPYPGDVGEVVARSILVCAREAQERQVTIERAIEAPLPSVYLDPDRLLQVVNNVLENAIQHSKPGGRVTVAARAVDADGASWVECSISDEGPGFREGDLGRVFEPFFSRRKGGTGLGLSIVHRIVDAHGGRVWASNRAGTTPGATITVRLPVAAGSSPPSHGRDSGGYALPSGK